ncbi:MAG: DUF4126 domain-containing protein [Candidatus Eiseniibacteriota bacterium]
MNDSMNGPMELQIMSGVMLAAVCGLRAFLPLLAVGIAARLGHAHLNAEFAWIASWPAIVSFGAAALLEMAADKIPVVDHALDLLGGLVRPMAGALAVLGLLPQFPKLVTTLIALGGAGCAFGVQAIKAKTRLASSATTLGHANPMLSGAEDLASFILITAAILAPLIAFLLLVPLIAFGLGKRPKRFGT